LREHLRVRQIRHPGRSRCIGVRSLQPRAPRPERAIGVELVTDEAQPIALGIDWAYAGYVVPAALLFLLTLIAVGRLVALKARAQVLVEAMYAGTAPLTAQVNGFFGLGIMRELDRSRFDAIVGRVKASGVAMVPTQILMDNWTSDATGDSLTSLPEFRYWLPQQVTAWRNYKNEVLAEAEVPREQREDFTALRRRFIKALHDAGVPFLLGSEAPQVWPGARADLLLLDANPLEDVANTTRIHGVLVNGRWLGPEERTRMLAALSSTP
jgi:hypothetical protein